MNILPCDNNHKNNKITSFKTILFLLSSFSIFTCWDITKMDSYNWISPSFANAPTLGPWLIISVNKCGLQSLGGTLCLLFKSRN
jgi:hypothetical protein